ncbi:MAG: LacI family transcriptional regulator [Firmicutes bacterium]|jgi:DNA-binding LacI/PurR family transcriptional regulator|nr:LacI family transcriptional regulator [Bacillota bacterium]
MATIYDVAKKAGVGVGTVSRVINGSPHVSPRTRERVLEAIAELDYQPHAVARSLATNRTNAIGVLVPFFTNYFFLEVLRGIQDVAYRKDQGIFLYNVQQHKQKEVYLARIPVERRVDGLIVITLRIRENHAARFINGKFPVILVDSYNPTLPSLVVDNAYGAKLATEHLLSLGHRKVAFINGLMRYHASRARKAGFEEAFAQAGLQPDPNLIMETEFERSGGRQAMAALWEAGKRPTAVFAASDLQAIGVMEYLQKQGVRVPDDVAVVGYDDIEMAELLDLTTIRQPMYTMGAEAAERLLEGLPPPPVGEGWPKVYKPELIVRKSSGS